MKSNQRRALKLEQLEGRRLLAADLSIDLKTEDAAYEAVEKVEAKVEPTLTVDESFKDSLKDEMLKKGFDRDAAQRSAVDAMFGMDLDPKASAAQGGRYENAKGDGIYHHRDGGEVWGIPYSEGAAIYFHDDGSVGIIDSDGTVWTADGYIVTKDSEPVAPDFNDDEDDSDGEAEAEGGTTSPGDDCESPPYDDGPSSGGDHGEELPTPTNGDSDPDPNEGGLEGEGDGGGGGGGDGGLFGDGVTRPTDPASDPVRDSDGADRDSRLLNPAMVDTLFGGMPGVFDPVRV